MVKSIRSNSVAVCEGSAERDGLIDRVVATDFIERFVAKVLIERLVAIDSGLV